MDLASRRRHRQVRQHRLESRGLRNRSFLPVFRGFSRRVGTRGFGWEVLDELGDAAGAACAGPDIFGRVLDPLAHQGEADRSNPVRLQHLAHARQVVHERVFVGEVTDGVDEIDDKIKLLRCAGCGEGFHAVLPDESLEFPACERGAGVLDHRGVDVESCDAVPACAECSEQACRAAGRFEDAEFGGARQETPCDGLDGVGLLAGPGVVEDVVPGGFVVPVGFAEVDDFAFGRHAVRVVCGGRLCVRESTMRRMA